MFVAITNTPRDYAWGSATAIPKLLGTPGTGAPQAELWLGTHPGSPSQIVGDGSLADLTTLPFLLKVLAAASPLSLQAHPTIEQAVEGFARENAMGVPLDSPTRNYKDELHKPELIFALTPFRALCGFRPAAQTRADLERLVRSPAMDGLLDRLRDDDDIRPTFEWLISRGPGVASLVESLVAAATFVDAPHFSLVGELAAQYPRDPGIAISLMLNLAVLEPGQALFLAAGNIHAYVEGVGIELMAASDNVLRGGLTPKHVDVAELLGILDFAPGPVPYLHARQLAPGVDQFRPAGAEFELLHATTGMPSVLRGDSIALCTAGSFTLTGRRTSASLTRGEAVYLSSDEGPVDLEGAGEIFVASATER
jgi:mannose-6-phosphate isomerase